MDVTTRTMQAIGNLLLEHYGSFDDHNDPQLARHYAYLWNMTVDCLKDGTFDREMLDAEYIKIAMREDVG